MGLRSGKFTIQGPRIRIRLSASHFPTVFVRWQGAPSYWKWLQRHISIKLRNFSFNTFKYTVPLMEVPSGMNHKPHLPFAQIAPHFIIFAAFFTVGMTYRGEFLLFRKRRTCLQKELNRDIWDSSENITHFHCSGVHAWYLLQKANLPASLFRNEFGFLAGLYDFKLAQNNLLRMALWLGSTLPVAESCGKAAWMALDVFLGDGIIQTLGGAFWLFFWFFTAVSSSWLEVIDWPCYWRAS